MMNGSNKTSWLILGALIAAWPVCAQAQAIVVSEQTAVQELTVAELRDIYFGRRTLWGSIQQPVQIHPIFNRGQVRVRFFALIGQSESAFQRFWVKLTLSGRARPPRAVSTDREVLEAVAHDTGAIGFIDGDTEIPPGVRIVPIVRH